MSVCIYYSFIFRSTPGPVRVLGGPAPQACGQSPEKLYVPAGSHQAYSGKFARLLQPLGVAGTHARIFERVQFGTQVGSTLKR